MRVSSALISIAVAFLAPCAAAQNIYKYVDDKGRAVYTDNPAVGTGAARRIEISAPPAASPAPRRSEAERTLLEQADQRLAALSRATDDMVSAFNALRAAEARREQGIEPLEGERTGRLFRPGYWQRQQALQADVDAARASLDDALARRNALR